MLTAIRNNIWCFPKFNNRTYTIHYLYMCDIASHTYYNTPYTYDADLNIVISKLEDRTIKLFKWFKENHLKANDDKCHLLVSTDKPMSINIEGNTTSSQEENFLDIKLDSTLILFENYVAKFCEKASKKLHALARVVN